MLLEATGQAACGGGRLRVLDTVDRRLWKPCSSLQRRRDWEPSRWPGPGGPAGLQVGPGACCRGAGSTQGAVAIGTVSRPARWPAGGLPRPASQPAHSTTCVVGRGSSSQGPPCFSKPPFKEGPFCWPPEPFSLSSSLADPSKCNWSLEPLSEAPRARRGVLRLSYLRPRCLLLP